MASRTLLPLTAGSNSLEGRAVEPSSLTEGEGSSLSTSTPWKRPLGLVVFIGIWCAVAVYNFYIADAMFGPEAALAGGSVGPASTYSLLVQDLTLRIFLQVISVVQLGVAYWLWRGSSFSYIAGLGISALDLLTVGSLFVLYYLAPKGDQLRTPFLYENMALILAFTGLTWLYLSRPKVRRYLTRWA